MYLWIWHGGAVHCGLTKCTLPSSEDNWDRLQQSEQRTKLEDYRSPTDARHPLFWLWLTFRTSQTSRQFLCLVLANRFDAFSCLSSYFFSLFSSPSGFTVITRHWIGCDGKMMCYRKNEALFTPQSVSWPKLSLAKSWTPVEKHWTAHWHYNTNTPRARQWQPAARTSSVFVSDLYNVRGDDKEEVAVIWKKEASVWQ